MDKRKLHDYILTGSIHTLSLRTDGIIKARTAETQDAITRTSVQCNNDEITSIVTINPNKYHRDIFKFSDFKETLDAITLESGIDSYQFMRTDFRLDNYAPRHYELYAKLNRYLITALALTYGTRNNYFSGDLLTLDQKTQVIKCKGFEVENYDRAAKSRETDNQSETAQARFEIRTVADGWRNIYKANENATSNFDLLRDNLEVEWFKKLDAALKNLDAVQQSCNTMLVNKFNKLQKAETRQFRTLTDFVMTYQYVIFTRKQLVDLYKRLDDSGADPVIKAANYKKRYGIEFFSKADMQAAVKEIKRAITHFCER